MHLIRDPADPPRSARPRDGRRDRFPHRTINGYSPEYLEQQILRLLMDGRARTFNRIAVELWDLTADTVFETAADHALWRLVGPVLEHTLEAPILFRVQPALLSEREMLTAPGQSTAGGQLKLDFAANLTFQLG